MFKFFNNLLKERYRILILGQEGTGKSSFLNKLILDENPLYIPTIGFGVESIQFKNYDILVWDCDINNKAFLTLIRHYYIDTRVVIFFVDSTSNENQLKETRELIDMVYLNEKQLENSLLLVFANKQDLPNALNITNLIDILGLHRIDFQNQNENQDNKKRKWIIQPCSVKRGDGINEGFNWIEKNL
ncbi:hypothetical protein ACTA71_006905 [Dictyostelium dimigraforme]